MERLTKFEETGDRVLPPPPMYDLDPVIPPYMKFGQEGHLYVVKPPGQDVYEFQTKIGGSTRSPNFVSEFMIQFCFRIYTFTHARNFGIE